MTVRVAINGFGRVGRCFLRSAHMRDANIEVVAINDVADAGTLAALLRHDSVYGRFPEPVAVAEGALRVGESRIAIFSEDDPGRLPWAELGVDVVIESTGRFRTRAGAARHLEAGARKVVISAPAKGSEPVDANVVLGSTSTRSTTPSATTSSRTHRARPTVSPRSRRSCTRRSASGTAS